MVTFIILLIAVILAVLGAFDRKIGGAHAGWLAVAAIAFVMLLPTIPR